MTLVEKMAVIVLSLWILGIALAMYLSSKETLNGKVLCWFGVHSHRLKRCICGELHIMSCRRCGDGGIATQEEIDTLIKSDAIEW